MGGPLDDIASDYLTRYGEAIRSSELLRATYNSYVRRRESTLLDAAAATAAINAIVFADEVDIDAATPQLGEAFTRAFPGEDLKERLEELGELDPESPQVQGFLSNWKGVYHEVLIRDRLNDGQQVGSIVLGEGQQAVLAEDINQPGFDFRVLNADGTEDVLLQAKATSEIGLLRNALEKYPDISIVTTDEVAAEITDDRVFPGGFSNEDLRTQVVAPMEEIWDGPVEELLENVLGVLPFIIIAATEGTKILMRRQDFQHGLRRAMQRGVKSGAAMGVGTLAAVAGTGMFSLPAVFLTRLGIDRYWLNSRVMKKLETDKALLAPLVAKTA